MARFLTKSPKETQKVASELAKEILQSQSPKGARIVALFGNLGAGKTTFAQGFSRALGIREKVVSPTFVIVKIYKISQEFKVKSQKFSPSKIFKENLGGQNIQHSAFKRLIHIDCYRLKSAADFKHLGLDNFFKDHDAIILIEWTERIRQLLPSGALKILFKHGKHSNERSIFLVPSA